MDALDKFVFGEACHPAFDIALRIENYTGVKTNKLARGSSSTAVVSGWARHGYFVFFVVADAIMYNTLQ